MASPLTVRNLTPSAIIIKSLECFEDPNMRQSRATAFPSAVKHAQSIAPSAPELGLHAKSFKQQNVDVRLEPWESYTLRAPNLEKPEPRSSTLSITTFRITVENEEHERFRIDTNPTYTQKASRAFTPLTASPSISYTALYHPMAPTAHLTIHSQHLLDYSKWMQDIADTLPLSAISIPGAHNAHTHYRALPSVRCQVVDVATQLAHGIRFLDIRVQPASATDTSKKDLYLVHGAFPVSLTGTKYLDPVLDACYKFLAENPSETVLVSLKREGVGSATDAHLAAILEKHYIAPHAEKWFVAERIPYLREVRGKLVLVRRYQLPNATTGSLLGLDATAWQHNSTHAVHGHFCVQDFCEIMHPSLIPDKLHHSTAHLVRAAALTHFIPGVNTDPLNPIPPGPLYLNFLTGSNFFRTGTWPHKIAKVVNRGVEEWICKGHHLCELGTETHEPENMHAAALKKGEAVGGRDGEIRKVREGDGGAGVVVMDMLGEGGDWDLVKLIVGLNMGVMAKVKEG
ncbi:PLC-like phosphodiesterase [Bimuria novae-zelandiae CBS 107.79]|uniref:PLC-like phosphodiesterase n=1 Tax=Bimuria novae-zelandiae CBS 107.79 TaxID=1447943 RepID=A0A6A5UWX7_9PLEO|nr:PLC-like phosphodiesterase [Bimuria novae-zelandiae CBS 107.79]